MWKNLTQNHLSTRTDPLQWLWGHLTSKSYVYHSDPLQWLWGHLTSKFYAVPFRPTSVTLRSLDFEILCCTIQTHFSDSEVTWLRNFMLYHSDPLQWLWGHLTSKFYAVPFRPTSVTLRSLDFEILCCTIQTHFSDSEVTWLRNFMLYHSDPLQWLWGHLTSKFYAVPSRPTSVTLRSLDFEILCCTIQTHFSDSEVTWLRNFMLYHSDPLQWLWGHLTSKFYVVPSRPTSVTLRSLDFEILCCTIQTHFSDSEVTWLRNFMLYHSDPLQWLWGHLTSKSYAVPFRPTSVTLRSLDFEILCCTIQTHFSDSEVTWLRNFMLYHSDPLQWLWGHLTSKSYAVPFRPTSVTLRSLDFEILCCTIQTHFSDSEVTWLRNLMLYHSDPLQWLWGHLTSKSYAVPSRPTSVTLRSLDFEILCCTIQTHFSDSEVTWLRNLMLYHPDPLQWLWGHLTSKSYAVPSRPTSVTLRSLDFEILCCTIQTHFSDSEVTWLRNLMLYHPDPLQWLWGHLTSKSYAVPSRPTSVTLRSLDFEILCCTIQTHFSDSEVTWLRNLMLYHPDPLQWLWGHLTSKSYAVPSRPTSVTLRSLDFEILCCTIQTHFSDSEVTWLRNLMLYHPDPLQWLWGHLTSKSYAVPSRPTSVTLRSLDFEILCCTIQTHFSDSEVTWLRNLMLYHPDPLQWLWGHLTSKSYAVPSRPTSVTLRSLDFEILCCTIQTHFSDSEVTWLRNLMLYHPDPLQWLWGHLTSKSYAVPSRPTSVTLRSLDFEILCCTIQTHFSDSEVTWLRNLMLYHPDPLQWLWGHLTSKSYAVPSRPTSVTLRSLDFEILCCTIQTHFSDSEVTWLRNLMLYHPDPLQWLWGHLTSKSYAVPSRPTSVTLRSLDFEILCCTIQTHFSDFEVTWLRNLMLYHPDPLQWLWGHLTSKSYAVPSRPTSVTLRSLDFEILCCTIQTHFSDSEVTWLRNLMLYHPDPLQWLWGHLTSKSYAVPSRPTSVTLRSLDFEILCCTIQTHFSDSEVTWLRNLMLWVWTASKSDPHWSGSGWYSIRFLWPQSHLTLKWLRVMKWVCTIRFQDPESLQVTLRSLDFEILCCTIQTHFSDFEVTWLRNHAEVYHPDPLQWLWGHLTSEILSAVTEVGPWYRPTSVTLRSLDFEILCCTIQTHFSDSEVTWLRNLMLYHPDPLQWLWGHLTSKSMCTIQTHFSDSEVTWLRNLMLYHPDPLQWLWGHLT